LTNRKYTLHESEEKHETEKLKENKNFVPEIIISESFK
jgi:hypothetical protein